MSNRTPRVLVVDDDAGFADGIKDILEDRGFHVDIARTKEQTLSLWQNDSYDVTFMDMNLREDQTTGIEVFREIKRVAPDAKVVIARPSITHDQVDDYRAMIRGYGLVDQVIDSKKSTGS